jgi:hypothetical protein
MSSTSDGSRNVMRGHKAPRSTPYKKPEGLFAKFRSWISREPEATKEVELPVEAIEVVCTVNLECSKEEGSSITLQRGGNS